MLPVFDLTNGAWFALAIGAVLVGICKTAIPAMGTVVTAIFAAILPARESTAVVLILLLVGDLFAVWIYRKDADWPVLRRLVPTVLIGLIAGAVVLRFIDDASMKRMIGVILLSLTLATIAMMVRDQRRARATAADNADAAATPSSIEEGIEQDLSPTPPAQNAFAQARWTKWVYGSLGGFTTMTANAGGPPMTLYFLAAGFDMKRFLGTQAWFFFVVNAAKVPFMAGVGLFHAASFGTDLLLVPLVIVGVFLGRLIIARIDPKVFNPLILGLTIVSAAYLLI